jgi:signal transduction histidine kinase
VEKQETLFAPAERAPAHEIRRISGVLIDLPLFQQIMDTVPDMIVVLNRERQIVFANRSLLNLMGLPDGSSIYGKRPGEALGCVHANEMPGGCGTTEFCRKCGAVNAILTSQKGRPDVQECRVIQKEGGTALDFRVWANPLRIQDISLTAFAIVDISHEKRQFVLERTFFHDLLNTVGGLKTTVELLREASGEERRELMGLLDQISDEVIEEINAHRSLIYAETGDLAVSFETVSSLRLLEEVASLYKRHIAGVGREIRLREDSEDISLITDRTLLRRVLGNMTKNALEAIGKGQRVTLCSRMVDETVEFAVHNPGYIPRDVQLQIFQRSFSTKGRGRGTGTYSIKLLTERYLHGRVYFITCPEQGTTFIAKYPIKPPLSA